MSPQGEPADLPLDELERLGPEPGRVAAGSATKRRTGGMFIEAGGLFVLMDDRFEQMRRRV